VSAIRATPVLRCSGVPSANRWLPALSRSSASAGPNVDVVGAAGGRRGGGEGRRGDPDHRAERAHLESPVSAFKMGIGGIRLGHRTGSRESTLTV
jgi:hypothetical protein